MRFSTKKGLRLEKVEVRALAKALDILRGIAQHSNDQETAGTAGVSATGCSRLLDLFDPQWRQQPLPLDVEEPVDVEAAIAEPEAEVPAVPEPEAVPPPKKKPKKASAEDEPF